MSEGPVARPEGHSGGAGPADGGLDLRLVPAAVLSWLAAAVAVAAVSATVAVAAGVLTATTAAAAVRCRSTGSRRGERPMGSGWATATVAIASAAAVLGSCAAQLALRESGALPGLVSERAVVRVVGLVRSEPQVLADPWGREVAGEGPARVRTVVAVQAVTGRGGTGPAAADLVVVGGPAWEQVSYGLTVVAHGRLEPAPPGGPAVAVLRSWGEVVVAAPPRPVDRTVGMFRDALLAVTDSLPQDARGLVPGAAIGDTSRIPPDLQAAMRDTGLTHVTAVSGGHFAILSLSVLTLSAALRLPRAARAVSVAVVMTGFVLLVHPQPSVVRAAAMGGVAVVGLVLGRPSRAVAALATAVVTLLVLDPWLARSYGFVLSVVATAAIVVLAPALARVAARWLPRPAAVLLAVPLAAQAACGPVIVLMEPAVSTYAVPANVLVAPAVVPATLLGVAATLAAPWAPSVAAALAHGAAWSTWWIATVARVAAAAPGAKIPWPAGPGGAVLLAALSAVPVALVIAGPRLAGWAGRPGGGAYRLERGAGRGPPVGRRRG